MTIFMVVFVPNRVRRLKAGGSLQLTISLHTTKPSADKSLRKAQEQFPTKEGYYTIEAWTVTV